MTSKTLFMETTEINPERTISEIEAVLIDNGCNAVLKEYHGGVIDAVSFRINVGGRDIPFRLPCRWQAIAEVFRKRKHVTFYTDKLKNSDGEKARRVAWRQILRWVEAQCALVQTDMVKMEEVFFPYIQSKSGQTLYELHEKNIGLLPERTGDAR